MTVPMRVGPTPVPVTAPPAVEDELVTKGYVPWSMSSSAPCAPSNMTFWPCVEGVVEHVGGVGDEGRDLLGGADVVLVHLLGVERLGAEEGVGDGVLLVAGVVDVRAQQRGVEQVDDAQAVAVDLVFVGRADAAAGGADGLAAGSGFGGELDHAVVGQDDLGAVGDEELAVDCEAGVAELLDFAEEGHAGRARRRCR